MIKVLDTIIILLMQCFFSKLDSRSTMDVKKKKTVRGRIVNRYFQERVAVVVKNIKKWVPNDVL